MRGTRNRVRNIQSFKGVFINLHGKAMWFHAGVTDHECELRTKYGKRALSIEKLTHLKRHWQMFPLPDGEDLPYVVATLWALYRCVVQLVLLENLTLQAGQAYAPVTWDS